MLWNWIFFVFVSEILLKWQEHWFCTYFALFSWCNGGEREGSIPLLWMKLLQLPLGFYEIHCKNMYRLTTLSYLYNNTTHWASNRSYRLVTYEQNDSHYKQRSVINFQFLKAKTPSQANRLFVWALLRQLCDQKASESTEIIMLLTLSTVICSQQKWKNNQIDLRMSHVPWTTIPVDRIPEVVFWQHAHIFDRKT